MLIVRTNQSDFEYDIHSLVKAFYPEQEVRLWIVNDGSAVVAERGKDEAAALEAALASEAEDAAEGPAISIIFARDKISLRLKLRDKEYPETTAALSPAMERIEIKNALKQLLYRGLSALTQKRLPWGALTGIRPVKLPMGMLAQGMEKEKILACLAEVYLVGAEKSRLALDIAVREREILTAADYRAGYSIYIGIPFCPTTCLYCSFTSYPIAGWRRRVPEYLAALDKELSFTAETFGDRPLNSVYIGGGTPTTPEPEQLEQLLKAVRDRFDWTAVKEFTVEAGRADSITAAKLAVLKKYGVNRISINPQTMKEETLRLIGRQHTVAQVREAFTLARQSGFDNINMDLILGLPGETAADVAATMAAVARMAPDGLTVHSLAVKRAAGLNRWVDEHGRASIHNTGEIMAIADRGARALGMAPYYLYRQKNMAGNLENIGYATPGHEGLYNILMMEEVQTIVALGAGSVSKRVDPDGRIERRDNVKDVELYLARIDEMIARKKQLFD